MEVQQIRLQQQYMVMDFLQQANIMFKKEGLKHLEQ